MTTRRALFREIPSTVTILAIGAFFLTNLLVQITRGDYRCRDLVRRQ